ncbi:MAG: ribosome-associated translation inhibitor RaiA [Patescibacteria group bacterium]
MKLTIKGTQLEITSALEVYLYEKVITPLEKRLKGHSEAGAVIVDVELAREGRHHHKGEVFRAEATVSIPPRQIVRIVEKAEDIRIAIDLLEEALMRKLEIVKGKTILESRRTQRKAKGTLHE